MESDGERFGSIQKQEFVFCLKSNGHITPDCLLAIITSPESWPHLGTQVDSESKLKKFQDIHKHINTENSLEIKQLKQRNMFVMKVALQSRGWRERQ